MYDNHGGWKSEIGVSRAMLFETCKEEFFLASSWLLVVAVSSQHPGLAASGGMTSSFASAITR